MNIFSTLLLGFFMTISLNELSAQGTTAQDFTVTTLEGETFNLYEKLDEGKHVVLHFFHAYCEFCTQSMPFLDNEYEKYGCNTTDLFLLQISEDGDDEGISEWNNEKGFLAPIVSGIDGGGKAVFESYEVVGVPGVMIIAPDRTFSAEYHSFAAEDIFDGIHADSSIEQNPDACSSVVSNTKDLSVLDLSIYPNPASDNIQVKWTDTEINYFEIHDVVGNKILTKQVGLRSRNVNIPLDNIGNGSYILTSYNQEGVNGRAVFQKF